MNQKLAIGMLFALAAVGGFIPFITDTAFDAAADYKPFSEAFGGDRQLLNLHVATDLLTALAYFSIPATLGRFTLLGGKKIPFMWFFPAFGLFIFGCGVTHFMAAYTTWEPAYWLSGVIKYFTVVASVGTLITLLPVVPKFLTAADEARLSEQRRLEIEAANKGLRESNERLKVEAVAKKRALQELEETKRALQNAYEDLKTAGRGK